MSECDECRMAEFCPINKNGYANTSMCFSGKIDLRDFEDLKDMFKARTKFTEEQKQELEANALKEINKLDELKKRQKKLEVGIITVDNMIKDFDILCNVFLDYGDLNFLEGLNENPFKQMKLLYEQKLEELTHHIGMGELAKQVMDIKERRRNEKN